MASYTTNLNLKKPAGSENVAIGDINNNMDAIDQAYGSMSGQIGDLSVLYTSSKNNLVSAINEIYPKDYNAIYNANTDRNTESNRIAAMEYMKSNFFDYGYETGSVRYQSGYYHFYLFMGEYSGADSCILEVCHNMTSVFIVWRRSSDGTYTKAVTI